MDDYKKRVENAMKGYFERQEPKIKGPTRHYDKPEKEVEKACLKWMRDRGWNVAVYESKATYNPNAGRYISQNMKAGTADCMGHMENGIGVVVEFKAPGRLSTFAAPKNHRQQEFVKEKIKAGVFACVVDSVSRLEEIFNAWSELRKSDELVPSRIRFVKAGPHNFEVIEGMNLSKSFLIHSLPKRTGRSKYDKDFTMEDEKGTDE